MREASEHKAEEKYIVEIEQEYEKRREEGKSLNGEYLIILLLRLRQLPMRWGSACLLTLIIWHREA